MIISNQWFSIIILSRKVIMKLKPSVKFTLKVYNAKHTGDIVLYHERLALTV